MTVHRGLIVATVLVLAATACTGGTDTTAAPTTQASTTSTTSSGSGTTTTTQPASPGGLATLVDEVTVETALGLMTWTRYELSQLITHAAPYGDGYVGLIFQKLSHRPEFNVGAAEPGIVATSPDGVAWTPLPQQPGEPGTFTPSVLNVVGTEIQVVGRALVDGKIQPDGLLAFTYDGSSWSEVSVDDPEPGYGERGGSLDIGTVVDESTLIRAGNNGEFSVAGFWAGGGGRLAFATQPAHVWPIEWPRSDVVPVWPIDGGYTTPAEIVGAIVENEGRFAAISWMGGGGLAWTSSDGATWESIEPITAPWPGAADRIVTPEVVDAGGLGWLAVGSFGAPSVVWLSADGITWVPLDGVTAPGPTDLIVPWPPPSTVVDDERILIYGRSPVELPDPSEGYFVPEPSPPMLWVGEPA